MPASGRAVRIMLLATYALSGCHKTVRVPAPQAVGGKSEKIVGVVLVSGREIDFPRGDGRLQRDTLYASEIRPIPYDSVSHLLVRRADPAMTFLAVLSGTALVLGAAAAIYAATKESCPFVYSWDGSRWVFDAEPYGGAVTRGLERDDFGLLDHLRPVNGEYRLLLTNEVNESQMTDLVRLIVVDHAPGVRPMPDEFGRFYSVARPAPPLRAISQPDTDLLPWLLGPDQLIWEMKPSLDPSRTRDTVLLTFARPRGAGPMKLIARVATGSWGSHQIRSLLGLYGSGVEDWYGRLDANPAAADSVRQWAIREGLYGLPVEVHEPDGWRVRGVLPGGGPFIAEDRVIPLDVSRVTDSVVELRLMPVRSYWAFNWFAADFTPEEPMAGDTLELTSATDRRLGDVGTELRRTDGSYHPLPLTGDFAALTFRAPPTRPGLERTVFVHARGWYRLRGLPNQPADTAAVERVFTEPGFAARRAAEEYRRRLMALQN